MSISVPIRRTAASVDVSVAATTPGSAVHAAAAARWKNCCLAPPVVYWPRGSGSRATRTLSGFKPRSTVCSRTKLRISNPAPTSSISDSATSTTTSVLAQAAAAKSAAHALAGVLERLDHVPPRRLQRRDEAEHDRRQHRDRQAEEQTGMLSRMTASRGMKPSGISSTRPLRPKYANKQPERHAADGEDQALDQQLAHEPAAAGAERRSDRHLLLARRGAGEQHVRDVAARDEQQQADGGGERVERRAELADDVVHPAHGGDSELLRVVASDRSARPDAQ